MQKKEYIDRIIEFCENAPVKPREVNAFLESIGTTPLREGCKIFDLIARPQINMANLSEISSQLKELLDASHILRVDFELLAELRVIDIALSLEEVVHTFLELRHVEF